MTPDDPDANEDVDMVTPPSADAHSQSSPHTGSHQQLQQNLKEHQNPKPQQQQQQQQQQQSQAPLHTGSTASSAESMDLVENTNILPESSADHSTTLTALTGPSAISPTTLTPPESIEAHIKTIQAFCNEFCENPIKDGDKAFLVSRKWLTSAIGDNKDLKHTPNHSAISPVNNLDIIWENLSDPCVGATANPADKTFVRLRPGLGSPADFALFPPSAWELLMKWPGLAQDQYAIVRTAHKTSDNEIDGNVQFEFYPPVLTIHRLWSANSPKPISQSLKLKNPPPPKLVRSASTPYKQFLAQAKRCCEIDLKDKVNVWRVPPQLPIKSTTPSTAPSKTNTNANSNPTPPSSPDRINRLDGSVSNEALAVHAPGEADGDGSPTSTSWKHLLLEVSTFLPLERDVERIKIDLIDPTANSNYNGKSTTGFFGLATDQDIVLDEHIKGQEYVSTCTNSSSSFSSTSSLPSISAPTFTKASTQDRPVATRSSSSLAVTTTATTRNTRSGRTSPAQTGGGGIMTRGRAQKSGRTPGCVGLQNLGNTCYMNAALQCIRSVEELTKYFLSKEWENEINRDNCLGHNGDVAASYANLLHSIYSDTLPNAVTPRQFKSTIGRYAPAFSGYGQQDSQEFLGFLLDGLQEDLSRIKKKPYIEKPDSTDEMIKDPVAIREMAEKVWDITKKRDDSVISDLFTGLYKSTLVCPECSKVSITFDPFNNLTLPLPVENKWCHTVKYFPLNDRPFEIVVELDRSATIKQLKQFVSARTGVPVGRLHGAEEWKLKFFKQYSNDASVTEEIQTNDVPCLYELDAVPTNFNIQESYRAKGLTKRTKSMVEEVEEGAEEELLEKMLVPVFHRRLGSTRTFHQRWQMGAFPHFIVVNPTESHSEEAIKRKILQKVATLSDNNFFRQDREKNRSQEDPDSSDTTDQDFAGTSGSDFGSSNDSKVVAQSVESEEDIVDVTMKGTAITATATAPAATTSLENTAEPSTASLDQRQQRQQAEEETKPTWNQTAPEWVLIDGFLPLELRNMFELSYFAETGANLATGNNEIRDDLDYPRLCTRMPDPATMASDEADGADNGTASGDDSSEDEAPRVHASIEAPTRMIDESDEDDDEDNIPAIKSISHRPKQQKGNNRSNNGRKTKNKKYGKKGNKRHQHRQQKHMRQQQQQQQHQHHQQNSFLDSSDEQVGYDGGPLIRLREGIIVDWRAETYDTLFENGQASWMNCETLPDPQLDKAQKARKRRRDHGITLVDCLDEFEREEVLSEQDEWYCPRCKEHRRATKKFDLWKTPDILVVHLKRFSSSGWRRDKIDWFVDFPITGLDLTKRVLHQEEGKEEVYDLIGVDCHWGGLGGGHYTAFAKNYYDGNWYSYNDSSVSSTTPDNIKDPSAYLLFYRRRSDQPLGGPRFKEIIDSYNQAQNFQSASDHEDSSSHNNKQPTAPGEGRRLGEGSSPTGSPSAFQEQEAAATHPQTVGLGGDHQNDSNESSDSRIIGPIFEHQDVNNDNDNIQLASTVYRQVHQSIENDDEAIDLDDAPPETSFAQNWSFSHMDATADNHTNSPAASDVAQHDLSEDDDRAFSTGVLDLSVPLSLAGSTTFHGDHHSHVDDIDELPSYEDVPPVMDVQDGDGFDREDIAQMWDQKQSGGVLEVPADGEDQRSEEAAEIHLDDEEKDKDKMKAE